MSTKIEWTDETWNPTRGCDIYSPGCKNCYAMRQAHRHSGKGGAYEGLTRMTKAGPVWTGEVRPIAELLDAPLHWKTPRRIFVDSMSDLFYGDEADRRRANQRGAPFRPVPDEFILQVWQTMYDCTNAGSRRRADDKSHLHTFQLLTKRPARMLSFVKRLGWNAGRLTLDESGDYAGLALPNLWLGVSVEDQASADERIPLLLQTPAAVRWISAEPLIGPVDLRLHFRVDQADMTSALVRERLNWVVTGGESGPGARPAHPDWFRSLRDQCAGADVPYFFKQWGAWTPVYSWARAANVDPISGAVDEPNRRMGAKGLAIQTEHTMFRVGKKAAGRQLDGRTHDEYPAA
jgi:protein gp37